MLSRGSRPVPGDARSSPRPGPPFLILRPRSPLAAGTPREAAWPPVSWQQPLLGRLLSLGELPMLFHGVLLELPITTLVPAPRPALSQLPVPGGSGQTTERGSTWGAGFSGLLAETWGLLLVTLVGRWGGI